MKRTSATLCLGMFGGALALATGAADAHADKPYIVFHDEDGSFAKTTTSPGTLVARTLKHYQESGSPLPEVISVWTTFPLLGDNFATYIVPQSNDTSGINIPMQAAGHPPLRAILFHNNVTALAQRSALQKAPLEGFSSYLFLLEFMHNWGPEIALPAPGPQDLIGFDYHWSFYLQGTSPAGGNNWHDNGDGTFTVVPRAPKDVMYTPIDLYLMGLATKDEVQPFGVLVGAVAPATPTDPLWGGAFAGHSFPWFDTQDAPFTVQATQRMVSIDDVIATNGARVPAAGTKSSWTLGIALVLGQNETEDQATTDEVTFDPVASDLAPAFHRATGQRGTLEVVTTTVEGTGGAGGSAGSGGSDSTAATSASTTGSAGKAPEKTSSGCSVGSSAGDLTMAAWLAGLGIAGLSLRKRRRSA